MKQFARSFVVSILAWQVRRLQKNRKFTTIAVVGSIGKTSTKFAVAQLLSSKYRVRFQEGNYNDRVSVPLVLFGQKLPNLFNPLAWLITFIRCEIALHKPYKFDIVVLELGTDGPGQIAGFKDYLKVDIAIVSAITPEHMEYFVDIDAVAKEELSIVQYAKNVLMNTDLVAHEYVSLLPEASTYGFREGVDYRLTNLVFDKNGARFDLIMHQDEELGVSTTAISEPQLYSLTAALAVGEMMGMTDTELLAGTHSLTPVSGRMQILKGIQDSMIIDDSYNSSPEAVKAALHTLYRLPAPQKIAVLGNMNELGSFSVESHKEIGNACDGGQIAELLTIGPDANQYLAAAAEVKGCRVTKFDSPYAAGEYLANIIQKGSIILVKGSQNKVYAEEAIKPILANPQDATKLVRQSPSWLKKKAQNFS